MEGRIVRDSNSSRELPERYATSEIARIPIANYIWATCKVALLLRYEVTGSFLTVVEIGHFNAAVRERELRWSVRTNIILRPNRARHEDRERERERETERQRRKKKEKERA